MSEKTEAELTAEMPVSGGPADVADVEVIDHGDAK